MCPPRCTDTSLWVTAPHSHPRDVYVVASREMFPLFAAVFLALVVHRYTLTVEKGSAGTAAAEERTEQIVGLDSETLIRSTPVKETAARGRHHNATTASGVLRGF